MFKLILLFLLSFNLFALEISMNSAKDEFTRYSTLDFSDDKEFICEEVKNDFDIVTEVICAFSKKPLQNIQKLQNDFFKVDTFVKKETFFISIKPFHKIRLFPKIFNLTKENSVFQAKVTVSSRWTVIGYKEKIPLINEYEKSSKSINFPFYMDKDKLPYVGSLDINGNPVHIKKVGDVTDYLKVKEYYQEKNYDKCMDIITEILLEYPNTLFKAELIYYKINLYSKFNDYDNVISNAKIYLKEYSSDENIPEILSLIAKAYAQLGLNIDADYFFDRLFSEHQDTVFAKWGYVYKGEMFEIEGSDSKAISFYKKALHDTQSIDVAAAAAYKLARLKLGVSQKESVEYINKIVNAKPEYFKENYKTSKEMMYMFEEEGDYDTAYKIAKALLDAINPSSDEYEILLKEQSLWLAKTKQKSEALESLNRYIKEFPDGDFIADVQIAKDGLFFETSDLNATMKLAALDNLIETYAGDSIGNKAIYERSKLLLEEKMYKNVLASKNDILGLDESIYIDTDNIIKDAAVGVMQQSLAEKDCKEVLIISNEYNITLSNEWDDGIYECAMQGGDYQLSKSIAVKNFKSDDIDFRKKWLFRYIKVDFATGNYSDVIGASKDLISLIEDDKESNYKEVYRYLFDTYDRLEKKNEMITAMADIEKEFGLDYKDIERYVSVMSIGSENSDDNIVIKYGTKIMEIQKSSLSNAQSPYVEFALYQAYLNKEDHVKSLEVMESLNSVELDKAQRSRQKYLLGTALTKLWRDNEAKRAYQESIDADASSAWAKLAKSAIGL